MAPMPVQKSSSLVAAYETHLTTLALDALLAEPSALQTQAHHLTSSLTSLTHTSYPTFLSIHQSTNALSASLADLSASLSSLVTTSIPELQDAIPTWHTRTADILHQRSKARLVLDQRDKLKDLLDVPLFIDSCVRNGYYQEALSLASHVATLASRPGAPTILASVHAEVKVGVAQMLVALLGTLHEPGKKLPALWKAVNFLRKMDVFGQDDVDSSMVSVTNATEEHVSGEELLALAFVSGRLACFTATLDPIKKSIHRLVNVNSTPTTLDGDSQTQIQHANSISSDHGRRISDHDQEDVARYLKKYIDAWREGAYDILTKYSTIFLEQQPHLQLNSSSQKANPVPSHPSSAQSKPSMAQPPSSLLPILCPHLLTHLVPLLRESLPFLSLPLLPSILTQLTYCATAFTRVGMDFRVVIGDAVSKAVASAVRRDLHDIRSITSEEKGAITVTKRPSEWLIVSSLVNSPPSLPLDVMPIRTPAHIPPQILASYPPLARHTNAFLGVLNALRLLAPVGIMRELAVELDAVLGKNGELLIEYMRPFINGAGGESNGGDGDKEEKVIRAAGDVYFRVLVPFVQRALAEGVYGVEMAQQGDVEGDGVDVLRNAMREWEDMRS